MTRPSDEEILNVLRSIERGKSLPDREVGIHVALRWVLGEGPEPILLEGK